MNRFLSTLCLFLAGLMAQAHTLWLEVAATATLGQQQEVQVFFGDPAERMSPERWFGNLREAQVVLIAPSGKETTLPAMSWSQTHGTTSFTPEETGMYRLRINHTMNSVGRGRKNTFQTEAFVFVGTPMAKTVTAGMAALQVTAPTEKGKAGKSVAFQFLRDGSAAREAGVRIVAPDGVTEKYTTDKKGHLVYTPREAGTYIVQFAEMREETGTLGGQTYERALTQMSYRFVVE